MSNVTRHDSSFFNTEKLKSIKQNNLIYVVFSTLGERETDLLKEKLLMLKPYLGNLIDKIFISHRREDNISSTENDSTLRIALEAIPEINIVDCASTELPDMNSESGKGADMRRTLYKIALENEKLHPDSDPVIVFLDSDTDINFFSLDYPISLACAVVAGKDFAKAGFWRKMGRAKKFTAQPLFSSIDHPSLRNLGRFTYPLSGECAARLSFFISIPFVQKYGIETSMLMDVCAGNYDVADVNLGIYDHQHRDDIGVQKISFGIIRTFLSKCEQLGLIELKNGAVISNFLRASYIDNEGNLSGINNDLSEKEYPPLRSILS